MSHIFSVHAKQRAAAVETDHNADDPVVMMTTEHMKNERRWQFWVDVGGTFTDCVALSPWGTLRTQKTLSSGRVKGAVDSVSAESVSDSLRRGEPSNFWVGWMFCMRDVEGNVIFQSKVAHYDSLTGTISFSVSCSL